MNRHRTLLAALLFATLSAAPATFHDGMLGSGTRAGTTMLLDDGGMLGSGTRSDGGGGTIGSGTRTGGMSFLEERGGYLGSGN